MSNQGIRIKIDKSKLAKQVSKHFDICDKSIEDSMSKEALERLYAAIRYTQQNLQKESYDKMDEEELISRPVPRLP